MQGMGDGVCCAGDGRCVIYDGQVLGDNDEGDGPSGDNRPEIPVFIQLNYDLFREGFVTCLFPSHVFFIHRQIFPEGFSLTRYVNICIHLVRVMVIRP